MLKCKIYQSKDILNKASYKVRKEICMHITNKGLSPDYAKASIKCKNSIKNEKPGWPISLLKDVQPH